MTTNAELNDAFDSLSETALRIRAERDALRSALLGLMHYREHEDYCEVRMTEFCTCGLKEATDAARLILNQTREIK